MGFHLEIGDLVSLAEFVMKLAAKVRKVAI